MEKYDTRRILISISKKQEGIVEIHGLRDFMRFLYNKLLGVNNPNEYHISYDLNSEGLEKMVSENESLFSLGPKRDIILVNKDSKEYKEDVDDVIQEIIDDYF